MKRAQTEIIRLLDIDREKFDEFCLSEGDVELSDVITALLAAEIGTASHDALRSQLDRKRTEFYRIKTEDRNLLTDALAGRRIFIDEYRRVAGSRVVSARTHFLAIAGQIAWLDLAGRTGEYLAFLEKELSEIEALLPEFNVRDFKNREDLSFLTEDTDLKATARKGLKKRSGL